MPRLRHHVTLTFDPLTLDFCGRSGIMMSIYIPNFSEICQSAAELLMINDRFFVRFRGCSNTGIGLFYTPGTICTKFGGNIVRSSIHTEFKNGGDILLGFQTTPAQTRALVSDKAKNRTF